MPNLILIRHGESQWNLENRFTGWTDVDLTPEGERQADIAGEILKDYKIDYLFTSVLKRAIRTADIILTHMNVNHIVTNRDQALNERHYGDLQGLNKAETGKKYGADQLKIWRRSFDIAPPHGESLKDTQERVLPYYFANIEPLLKQGKNILVSAHGNSLRALIMHLNKLTKEEVVDLDIPTGIPLLYTLDDNCNVLDSHYLISGELNVKK